MITDLLQNKKCPFCSGEKLERVDSIELAISNLWALLCKKCRKGNGMTTKQVADPGVVFKLLLEAHGIPKGSRSWQDYERAKRIIERVATSSKEYDEMIKETCEWVGV